MCIHSECVRTRQVHKSYRKLTINCIKALHWSSKYSCPELNSLLYVSHSTELLLMCLACQHFDFNSDWFSDDLHMSSTWYLRTIVNEFKHSIQQTLVGQERVTNPWERLRGRLGLGRYYLCFRQKRPWCSASETVWNRDDQFECAVLTGCLPFIKKIRKIWLGIFGR